MYSMASLYIVNKVTLLDKAIKQIYWGDGRWSETGIRLVKFGLIIIDDLMQVQLTKHSPKP